MKPKAALAKGSERSIIHHSKTMQHIWGRHARYKTSERVFRLEVIRFFSKRLDHLFHKFLTLYLHRELGQNRHHFFAWMPSL